MINNSCKICIVIDKRGVTLYGNKYSFQIFSKEMDRLAKSNPSQNFEFHTLWHLSNRKNEDSDIWYLMDQNISKSFNNWNINSHGFELTFMVIEDDQLQHLKKFKNTGFLPEDWNKGIE